MSEENVVNGVADNVAVVDPVAAEDTSKGTLLGDAKEDGSLKVEDKKVESTEVKKDESAVKEVKVPEAYDLKVPEGMDIDKVLLEKVSPIFKEIGLTNEQAQKLADVYAPYVKSTLESHRKTVIDGWNKQTEEWKNESLKMLGAEAPQQLAFAAKVINKFGTEYKNEDGSKGNDLRDLLEETRVGNHPAMTRLFIGLGKLISSDSFVEPTHNFVGKDGVLGIYDHPTSKATLK